ncbi:MAG: glycosyltransferase family 9 protein [Cytophagales bacterium]|nr:glycosyltransferase family 9 protein [Cytophagales bacterium]MDW8384744.1 glycosyltransferase family 9 protein [Flammeovirgaceae bacterium]
MPKILLIQTAFLGDVVLATSLIEKIKFHFPDAQLDFLLRKGNESLLEKHPYLHQILIWDKKQKYRSIFKLISKIRKEQYQYVINLQRFLSSGIITVLSGAKYKVGFDKNPMSLFFTEKVPHIIGDGTHEIERNNALLFSITKSRKLFKPRLYPSETDYHAVQDLLKEPYLTIFPTSVWFTKQFPQEKWVEFLQKLSFQGNIYLMGSHHDYKFCEQICQQFPSSKIKILAGKLTLLQSAVVMKHALMNYVNDSAPLHIASAMNAPVTAIFCSTVPSFGFTPLSDDSAVIETNEKLECRPCGLHGRQKCPKQHFRCATTIDIERLIERIKFLQ